MKKAIKDAIYIDGSVVSFSKTKEGAKSGALDWNGNKKNAYLVIVSQYGQGLDLNEFAKTCKEMFDGVKQNIQKDKQLPNGKKNDFKNKFNNVSKETNPETASLPTAEHLSAPLAVRKALPSLR